MKSTREEIEAAVRGALAVVVGEGSDEIDPLVRPTQDPKFGDYQSNVALGLAKRLGRKPREVAEALVAALQLNGLAEAPEIAGPGFINFRLRPEWLAARLGALQTDPRLGVPQEEHPQRIVVDYSGPNLAKEMHVGHLRSTIIGDSIARLLEFQGHDIVRLNHVGDWGTQFGMLLQYVRESQPDVLEHPERFRLDDLEAFYVAAKRRFDSDPAFADASRRAVVELQSGDPTARQVWEVFCAESLRHAHEVYQRLGVSPHLIDRGESFYNSMLDPIAEELLLNGEAVEDEGAVCVFLEEFRNREGGPMPLMVRKTGGGYSYDATDLAGVVHRIREEHADRVIYITDVRQRDHFLLVFAGARKVGFAPESVRLEHVGFGMVLGNDRQPFKTRDGGTIKLKALLDEAETRSLAAMSEEDERRKELTPEQRAEVARVVGLGAVKYFDLSHNVTSDYVFDWDVMLALEGNTAPYMIYAYVRTKGIERRAGVDFATLPAVEIILEHPTEIALAKQLLEFPTVVRQVAEELRPHVLTDYLFTLSRSFSAFFDRERGVRVIDAEPEAVRLSRLRLCDLTARTLRRGLDLLGIEVVEQM